MTLVDSLQAAPDLLALRAAFSEHAEPSQGWPPHRAEVRRLADSLRKRGDIYRAALVLIAQLEDLRRYFEHPDDDSDGGWHRGEGKRWELWATDWRLARLFRAMTHPPHRRVVQEALRDLDQSELEGWRLTSSRLDQSEAPSDELTVCPQWPLDVERLRTHLGETCGGVEDDEGLMNRIARLREAVEERLEAGSPKEAARLAVVGLTLATSFEKADSDYAQSDERDAVLSEEVAVFDDAIRLAVQVGGPQLRDELRQAIPPEAPALAGRLRRLAGVELAEAVQDIARLKKSRVDADDDARLEIDMQLVHDLGSQLDDETYLALCREHGWTTSAMDRLFARDRVDEALAEARRAFADHDGEVPPWSLRDVAKRLLQRGFTQPARSLLEPYASFDAEHAELFARCLVAADDDRMGEACQTWFSRRPTANTYQAIAQLLPPTRFVEVAPRLREALLARRQYLMALRIAVADVDVDAIVELVTALPPADLAAARSVVAPLVDRLPTATRRILEPSPRPPAPTASNDAPSNATDAGPAPPLAVGDQVTHPKFGQGVVVSIEQQGDDSKLAIDFAGAGTKKLLSRFVTRGFG